MNISLGEFLDFSKSYMTTFLNSMEISLQKLFNCTFTPSEEFVANKSLEQTYSCIIEVPFIGSISGSFLIELERNEWENQFFLEFDLREEKMFFSAIKELLNVASSISLEALRVKHPDLRILCPRIILGKIHYPDHRFISSNLTSKNLKPIHCHICFNEITPGSLPK